MARYRLYNIRICIDRDGRRYIRAIKHNMDNPKELDSEYVSLSYDSRAGELFAPYFSKENNGTGEEDRPIPNYLTEISGEYKLYTPNSKFFWKKFNGEYIKDESGNVKVFESFYVFCEYSFDEFGRKQYWPKSFIDKRGRQEFNYRVDKGEFVIYSKDFELQLNKDVI